VSGRYWLHPSSMLTGAWSSSLLINSLGFLWPCYRSFKALHKENNDISIDTKSNPIHFQQSLWLQYWIIFAIFNIFEFVFDVLISWLPFYYDAKVLFIVWLQHPYTQGAVLLYGKYVEPALQQHQPVIDEHMSRAWGRVQTFGWKDVQSIIDFALGKMNDLTKPAVLAANSKPSQPKENTPIQTVESKPTPVLPAEDATMSATPKEEEDESPVEVYSEDATEDEATTKKEK